MMAQSLRFEENLLALSEKAPELALGLTEEREALEPWESFEQTAEVCFVLGIASGLIPPSGEDEHLVLVDWNSSHLRAFLELEEAHTLLTHPNVHFTLLDYAYLQGLFSGLTAQVEIHPSYLDDPFAEEVSLRLQQDNQTAYRVVDELLNYPHIATSHILENLEALPHSIDAAHFFGKFPKVPAIICGAGPSLDKHLPALARLKEHALLFAPGSALNALSAHGLLPHFGAGLDPYHAQYERLMMGQGFEVPLFYTGRWLPEARRCHSGPLIYVSGTEHPLARWIDGEVDQRVEEGSSGVHLCTELARLMGCDPIIFVGMDLAYTDGKLYGSGVEDGRDLEDRAAAGHYLDGLVCQGELVTQWKWLEEAKWLSNYSQKHPTTTFWNATGGGLGLGKIPVIELDGVSWGTARCLEEEVRSLLQGPFMEEREELCARFGESLQRCEAYLEELQDLEEGGRRSLLEVELEGEIAYQTYLSWPIAAFRGKLERARRGGDLSRAVKEKERSLLSLVKELQREPIAVPMSDFLFLRNS